ncbi:MAG: site-specific integrase [Pseudomonadota bacterium]|nr:site-specific integrase [Pseudomonadota bacterium]
MKKNLNLMHEARRILSRHVEHGLIKAEAKFRGKIASIGTERNYRSCLAQYLAWCEMNGISPEWRANLLNLNSYLEERTEWVKQKTLNQERQALQLVFQQELPVLRSMNPNVLTKRSYRYDEFKTIVNHQEKRNQITTWLAFFSGIRAHEAATMLPRDEREPSQHRHWDERRFSGMNSQFELYTVVGKGGLVREVAVPRWLVKTLEQTRRLVPIVVSDREIRYLSHYNIGLGHAWSQSFSTASKSALGWSRGGHGLRHSYAKWRLKVLVNLISENGPIKSKQDALKILSEELGHFRLDIIYAYLR